MKINNLIFKITLSILVAIGCQFLIVGLFTFNTIDFSGFGILNWILESIYLLCAITFSIYNEND
jgi:hypothetical protein